MTTTESLAIRPPPMANLLPRLTGLPMIVWGQERGGARHDIRIKVNPTHGHWIDYRHLVSVALRPQPHVIAPVHLAPDDLRQVSAWLRLNEAAKGRIYTDELLEPLQRLE